LLANEGFDILNLRIMIEEQDLRGINHNLERVMADNTLLMALAEICASKIEAGFTQLYPTLIKTLLYRGTSPDWKAASQLLVTFKRYCLYYEANTEEWLHLRDELREIYQADSRFVKKFGNILRE
jgi:hypothetical protein